MTNLHILQHDGCEEPGAIITWARARGLALSDTHLYRGESLPDPENIDLLVIMGGPMNIYQDRDFPWLREERKFIEYYVRSGRPCIGICLGSQFLADALGGRVLQNPHVEIGWHPVHFTPEARARFPFLPASLDAVHWHGDTFELPPGAMRLASSTGCANQGFLYDDRVLALQFHPEMMRDGLAALVREFGDQAAPSEFVQAGETILAATDSAFAAGHKLLHELLDAISTPCP